VDPVRAAACVALYLHLIGCAGEWSATYREPSRLGVGRFVIARASGHRVRAGAGHLLLSPGEEGVTATELVRTPEGWRALRGESLQVVRLGALEFPLLSRGDLDLLVTGEALRDVRADHEGVVDEWTSAVALLQRYAPPFAAWVSDIVRSVIPLEGSETIMRSSTERHRFSTVAISFRCRPVQIAEALVHESSHEYLQIAGMASPLENGTDPRAYDSPLRRALRPIGSILLAFHAVQNILLFYRECLSRGFEDDGYCAAWAVRHEKQAAQMREDLMHSRALTEAGRALVTSLR
jgi:HEXXH motif-containing protein